jgi:hypothetical protein
MNNPDPRWMDAPEMRDENFIRDLVLAVLQNWKLLVLAAVAAGLLGAGLAVLRPKYEASGFYYTPGWSLAEFKRFRSEFGSSDVLTSFLREVKPKDTAGAELLQARAMDSRFWDMAVKPLYPMTKRDAKEVFEATKDRELSSIIGLDLAIEGTDPGAARAGVLILGDYLTQTLLLSSLQNWIASGQAAVNSELMKAENQVLTTRFSIEQSRARVAELRSLQTKYPESQRMEARQVVTADANSARYLAPIAQVIALEAGVAEANESLRRLERRAKQLKIEAAFFGTAAQQARATSQGWTLLDQLLAIKKDVFMPLDNDDDATRELSNRFNLELKSFKDQFSIGFGFRSPVLEPTRSSRSPTRFGIAGAAAGLLLGLGLVAVLGARAGWRRWSATGQPAFEAVNS